jgi:hypothetical protein
MSTPCLVFADTRRAYISVTVDEYGARLWRDIQILREQTPSRKNFSGATGDFKKLKKGWLTLVWT